MDGRLVSWLLLVLLVTATGAPIAATAQDAGGPLPDDYYAQVLGQGGWQPIERHDVDLAGDGQTETLLLVIGTDCGSCHAKELVLFSGSSPLGAISLDDPTVQVEPGFGVEVAQPVRLPDEPMCCPTARFTMRFRFEADAQTLVPEPQVSIDGGDARAVVATYYELLNGHWYRQAHELLSSNMQRVPFDAWLESAQSIQTVSALEVANAGGSPGAVRVRVEQTTQAPDGSTEKSGYTGTWSTVQENGAWRLDHLSITVG